MTSAHPTRELAPVLAAARITDLGAGTIDPPCMALRRSFPLRSRSPNANTQPDRVSEVLSALRT